MLNTTKYIINQLPHHCNQHGITVKDGSSQTIYIYIVNKIIKKNAATKYITQKKPQPPDTIFNCTTTQMCVCVTACGSAQ